MARLPPLNALRAFEVTARLGSFVRAGAELGVTPAAVSQQVKHLERFIGLQLFSRSGNRLTLTDAGVTLVPQLSSCFAQLATVTQLTKVEGVSHRLTVSAVPSVAHRWLTAVLADFTRDRPEIGVGLRIEDDPVEFERHGIDLRFCYGEHLYPHLERTRLHADRVMPLCAPDFMSGRDIDEGRPGDRDLIHTDWGPAFASQPTWADWFAARGVDRRPDMRLGHQVGTSAAALEFAAAGMGLVLGQGLLAQADLASGRLIQPFGPALVMPHCYCLVSPTAAQNKPGLRALTQMLQARADTATRND